MKYMYSIAYKKSNDNTIFIDYVGGDTEDQAKAKAINSAVDFHNQYSKNKLVDSDITITDCKLQGDYPSVLKELSSGG